KPLRRHVVLVFLDRLDVASARAIQYAKTLAPDELRAIHFDLDPIRTEDLIAAWQRLGLGRLTLDLVDCPDRRLTRGAAEVVLEFAADAQTEVTVLIPQLKHRRLWHRFLHDRTADSISEAVGVMPHVNVTIVPYHLGDLPPELVGAMVSSHGGNGVSSALSDESSGHSAGRAVSTVPDFDLPPGCAPIASATYRQRSRFAGRVQTMRVQSLSGVASLELRLVDPSGSITIVFTGRRSIPGVKIGSRLIV